MADIPEDEADNARAQLSDKLGLSSGAADMKDNFLAIEGAALKI